MIFYTDNNEVFRIDSTGNLGIGVNVGSAIYYLTDSYEPIPEGWITVISNFSSVKEFIEIQSPDSWVPTVCAGGVDGWALDPKIYSLMILKFT